MTGNVTAVTDDTDDTTEGRRSRRSAGRWDDGLIARRAAARAGKGKPSARPRSEEPQKPQKPQEPDEYDGLPRGGAYDDAYGGGLRGRLDALRELVGLSRTRIDATTLAEAGRVLDEAAARQRLSARHTVVSVTGATGSGKSMLFNALAGAQISDTGLRRPTTSAPIACSWTDGAAGAAGPDRHPRAAAPQAAARRCATRR